MAIPQPIPRLVDSPSAILETRRVAEAVAGWPKLTPFKTRFYAGFDASDSCSAKSATFVKRGDGGSRSKYRLGATVYPDTVDICQLLLKFKLYGVEMPKLFLEFQRILKMGSSAQGFDHGAR